MLDFYGNVFRTGVDGVFHDLLDDGGRALNHFAGGDQFEISFRKTEICGMTNTFFLSGISPQVRTAQRIVFVRCCHSGIMITLR